MKEVLLCLGRKVFACIILSYSFFFLLFSFSCLCYSIVLFYSRTSHYSTTFSCFYACIIQLLFLTIVFVLFNCPLLLLCLRYLHCSFLLLLVTLLLCWHTLHSPSTLLSCFEFIWLFSLFLALYFVFPLSYSPNLCCRWGSVELLLTIVISYFLPYLQIFISFIKVSKLCLNIQEFRGGQILTPCSFASNIQRIFGTLHMVFPMSQNWVNLVKSQRKYGMFGDVWCKGFNVWWCVN
jgi:hypothetical protein